MHNLPDYITWASMETLSPHSIACLMLGVSPPPKAPDLSKPFGNPPGIPDDVLDTVDREEWRLHYERIYAALRSGIDVGTLPRMINGEPAPHDAICYLAEAAQKNNWESWFTDTEFFRTVISKQPSRVGRLEAEVARLTDGIRVSDEARARREKGRVYTNRNLEWLDRAIDEFYDEYPERCPTRVAVTDWIVDESGKNGAPVSRTSATRIAVILTPDERKPGGRRSRK